jgi:hypothetical protein
MKTSILLSVFFLFHYLLHEYFLSFTESVIPFFLICFMILGENSYKQETCTHRRLRLETIWV